MKLYLNGHDYKYATEQMLLTLFPGQRPQYPEEEPEPEIPAIPQEPRRHRPSAPDRAAPIDIPLDQEEPASAPEERERRAHRSPHHRPGPPTDFEAGFLRRRGGRPRE